MREVTTEFAREFVAKADEIGANTWDDPENVDDAQRVTRANELIKILVGLDENKGTANEGALQLIRLAEIPVKSEVTRDAYAKLFNEQPPTADGAAPVEQPQAQPAAIGFGAPEQSASPPGTPPEQQVAGTVAGFGASSSEAATNEQAAVAAGIDIESIYPGYDDAKVKDIAAAILASAASGDLLPEEWEQIKAYESANEDRKTIRELQPEFKAPEPLPTFVQPTTHRPEQFDPSAAREDNAAAQLQHDGDTVQSAYNGETVSRVQQEGLTIEYETFDTVPPLPIDITDVSDGQISRLGAMYHSVFGRAQALLSKEEGRASYAEHLEREAERDAFVQAYEHHKSEIPEDKRTQPTALEAARKQAERDAESSESVRLWRARKVRHNAEARELKALAGVADKAVWRIDKELDRRARSTTTAHAAR